VRKSGRGREKKRDRDLERLAMIERLSRSGAGAGAGPAGAPATRKGPEPVAVARYARFRQAAGVLFGLGLLSLVWGAGGVVLAVAGIVGGESTFLAGAARVTLWLFASTALYGILKGLGEALLLWSDLAELVNTGVELSFRERDTKEGPPPG